MFIGLTVIPIQWLASRHLRAGHPRKAYELYGRYVRRHPHNEIGWVLWAHSAINAKVGNEFFAILRSGNMINPVSTLIAKELCFQLIHAYFHREDAALLEEAELVAEQLEARLGKSAEALCIRSEISQLQGRLSDARALVLRAHTMVAQIGTPDDLTMVASAMASIPGMEDHAARILQSMKPRQLAWSAHALLHELLKERDPAGAADHLRSARERFDAGPPAEQDFSAAFDHFVEHHQLEMSVYRRALEPAPL